MEVMTTAKKHGIIIRCAFLRIINKQMVKTTSPSKAETAIRCHQLRISRNSAFATAYSGLY